MLLWTEDNWPTWLDAKPVENPREAAELIEKFNGSLKYRVKNSGIETTLAFTDAVNSSALSNTKPMN